ncbi:MAG: DUF4256 domain-containing protein [Bacteroidetes bacterium]|nr:DUF4256 domain-containing protein [Bacteroidota bacterium]
MAKKMQKLLDKGVQNELLDILKRRFLKNKKRHPAIDWDSVEARLLAHPDKLWSLNEMELSDGEPDVVALDSKTGEVHFFDCAAESPKGRRSLCYDREAWEARKEFKPSSNVMDMAAEMGIEVLTETEYRYLQQLGPFDSKTSSWLKTPENIRALGGAIFGDFRFGQVFVYHNGAQSYYGSRAFRGCVRV